MRKYLLALAVLLLAASPAFAQFNSPNALGWSRGFSARVSSGVAAYTGPGDIVSFTAWWSNSRAYSAAKRGSAIINVCNSTGGTDVGCADMVTDASTGILTPATISSISCPGANCTIKTYYDQVGSNNCTQATIANRLTLTASVFGSIPGGVGGHGTTSALTYNCTAVAASVPWSMYSVSNQTAGGSASYDTMLQENGAAFDGLFTVQATPGFSFECPTNLSSGTLVFPNKFIMVGICGISGTTGAIITNGTTVSGTTGNTALTTSGYTLHNWRNNGGDNGEGGFLAGNLTSTATALTTNAATFYGISIYTGPGDVVASAVVFYSLRAYNRAYAQSAGKLVNVVRASDSHACDVLAALTGGMGVTANCGTGGDNGQTASSFCNATTCTATKWYNQANVGSFDVSQATVGLQPTLTFNCLGSLPCLKYPSSGADNRGLFSATSPTQAQPLTYSQVYFVPASPGCGHNSCSFLTSDGSGNDITTGVITTADPFTFYVEANSATFGSCGTVSSATWHASQAIINAASSSAYTDGSSTACTGTVGTNGMANNVIVMNDSTSFQDSFVGSFMETGAWPVAFSAGQQSSMNSNQHTYYGF